MADFDWRQFLQQWRSEMLASPMGDGLPPEVRASSWLGFPPATDEQLERVGLRLGIELPLSYRAFLKVSNGWRRITHAINCLWGTDQLQWFREKHSDWIRAYTRPLTYGPRDEPGDEEYFAYGQMAADFKPSHFKEALQISSVVDSAVCLLNPQVMSKDGEWEAWFLADWLPGVHRYRSFLELMLAEHAGFAGLDFKQHEGVLGELPREFIGGPEDPKRRVRKQRRRGPKFMGKLLKEWTLEELLALAEQVRDSVLHADVVHAIGQLGDPEAIEPLLRS